MRADRADLIAFASVSEPADHVVRYPGGDVTHYFGIWFVVRRWAGTPTADGEELTEVGWFDRDALPAPLMHSSAVAFAHTPETGDRRVSGRLTRLGSSAW